MKAKLGWLILLVPIVKLAGDLLGVPDLGPQFEAVVPHIQAVADFLVLLATVFGGYLLHKAEPGVKKN